MAANSTLYRFKVRNQGNIDLKKKLEIVSIAIGVLEIMSELFVH